MNKTQQWVAIAAVAIVAILAAGWFFVVAPQHTKADALHVESATQRAGTASLHTQLSILQAQSKQLPAKQAELAKFGKQIPNNAELPTLIRSLSVAASTAGVDMVSIAPSAPTAQAPVAPAVATTPAAPVAGQAAPRTLAAPSPTTSTLQSIGLTIKLTGTYAQLEQFVANLEGLQRVLLVNAYNLTSGGAPAAGTTGAASASCTTACPLNLELTGQVFSMPALAAAPVAQIAK
jgi:Tfp pilus assembly protein PilO